MRYLSGFILLKRRVGFHKAASNTKHWYISKKYGEVIANYNLVLIHIVRICLRRLREPEWPIIPIPKNLAPHKRLSLFSKKIYYP